MNENPEEFKQEIAAEYEGLKTGAEGILAQASAALKKDELLSVAPKDSLDKSKELVSLYATTTEFWAHFDYLYAKVKLLAKTKGEKVSDAAATTEADATDIARKRHLLSGYQDALKEAIYTLRKQANDLIGEYKVTGGDK